MTGIARLEWRRLGIWALAGAALALALLAFFARTMDLLRQPHAVVRGGRRGGFRRRPVARHRPAGELAAARCLDLSPPPSARAVEDRARALLCGTLALLVGIGLPALAYVAFCRLTGFALVDARHWLLPVAGFDIALAGYLCGAFIALAPRRYGALILVLPALFAGSRAVGPVALLIQWAIIAWLVALVLWRVRPDPSEPPRRLAHILLLVAPVQMACWLLLMFVGSFLFQIGWIMTGTHPLTHPPPGGFIEASRTPGDALLRGLAAGPAVSLSPVDGLWARRGEMIDFSTAHARSGGRRRARVQP